MEGLPTEIHSISSKLRDLEEQELDAVELARRKAQERFERLRQPHLDKRNKLLGKVPGFWQAALLGYQEEAKLNAFTRKGARIVHPAEVEALIHVKDVQLRNGQNGSYEVRVSLKPNNLFKERSISKSIIYKKKSLGSDTPDVVSGKLTAISKDGKILLRKIASEKQGSVFGWLSSRDATSMPFSDRGSVPFEPATDLGKALQLGLWDEPQRYYYQHVIEHQTGKSEVLDAPGPYRVVFDGAWIGSSKDINTCKKVGEVRKGSRVMVKEVVTHRTTKRVRGRIDSPAGWVSLCHTKSGFRWAKPEPSKTSMKEKVKLKSKFQAKPKTNRKTKAVSKR